VVCINSLKNDENLAQTMKEFVEKVEKSDDINSILDSKIDNQNDKNKSLMWAALK
jgi:hypothetical protein